MESEYDRLVRLYRELGDEHLKDLADEAEDLTGDARTVLAAEMRRRGFAPEVTRDDADRTIPPSAHVERESGFGAGIPGMFPSGAATVEQALEHGGEQRQGFVALISFYDGHELTRACDALDDSEVEFALEEKSGDALVGAPSSFEIWVASADADLAQRVLREKLGLFPLPEVEDAEDEAGTRLLGTFETRAEAEEVSQVLVEAGIQPTLTEPEAEDEDSWWTIEVPAADLDRGLLLVAQRLQMES